jgi:hypothetical protein
LDDDLTAAIRAAVRREEELRDALTAAQTELRNALAAGRGAGMTWDQLGELTGTKAATVRVLVLRDQWPSFQQPGEHTISRSELAASGTAGIAQAAAAAEVSRLTMSGWIRDGFVATTLIGSHRRVVLDADRSFVVRASARRPERRFHVPL